MEREKKYFAFVSYQHFDEEWAKWLVHELEHYRLPSFLNQRDDLPKELRPIFRDIDELSAGNLPKQIQQALLNSNFLIVVCSPYSAKSKWVNQEVEDFINRGRTNKIFPFIINGTPISSNPEEECFPPALRNLPVQETRLGGNVNHRGRDAAFIKIVAGMLNLNFDLLWQRYEREKAEEERAIREQHDNLLKVQSLFLAEKATNLINNGDSYKARLLALEALPQNMANPNRPFVIEAEIALRNANQHHDTYLTGHTEWITSISFSPDNRLIVSGSGDKTVRIWDVSSGHMTHCLYGHDSCVDSVAFSPDGKLIGSASRDKTIRIWDVQSGHALHILHGHSDIINSICFSPDGRFIASGSNDNSVILWDTHSGNMIKQFVGDEYDVSGYREDICVAHVEHVAFSPDGKQIISSLVGEEARVWDTFTGELKGWIYGRCVMYSPNGKLIGSVYDNNINILDAQTHKLIHKLVGHTQRINSINFSSDSNYLVSTSGIGGCQKPDNSIRIWNLTTGECVRLWGENELPTVSASFSSDRKRIISSSWDKIIKIRDFVANDQYHLWIKKPNPILCSTFSPNGNLLAFLQSSDKIEIWDFHEKKKLQELIGHEGRINSITFSSDGKRIISGSSDETIRIWDVESGSLLNTIEASEYVYSIAISPDDKIIAATCSLGLLNIWDTSSGEIIQTFLCTECALEHFNNVSFSPNGEYIVIAASYSLIILKKNINYTMGSSDLYELNQILKGHTDHIGSAYFSPDGKDIVSASWDRTIKIWDFTHGIVKHSLEGHTNYVDSASFSFDGKRIVSASWDKTIKVWDSHTGIQMQSFECPTSHINSVAFSPFDCDIMSADADGSILLWHCPNLQQLIKETKQDLKGRQLTPEERREYYLE